MSSTRQKFEFFDVTADVGVIAYGSDLNELFENAALATFDVMCSVQKVSPEVVLDVSLRSSDLLELLNGWLTQLLAIRDIEGMMFGKFEVDVDENRFSVKGRAFGETTKDEHEVETEVKAVTYHQMEITKKKNIWKARFILDV